MYNYLKIKNYFCSGKNVMLEHFSIWGNFEKVIYETIGYAGTFKRYFNYWR
jgi:hypothetical protein